jgi:hypothetical protein
MIVQEKLHHVKADCLFRAPRRGISNRSARHFALVLPEVVAKVTFVCKNQLAGTE